MKGFAQQGRLFEEDLGFRCRAFVVAILFVLDATPEQNRLARLQRFADAFFLEWLRAHDHLDAAKREKAFASDRPGRAFDSHGSGRHAMASSESGRRHEVRLFARQLADYLNNAIATGDFEHIVLIASPAFLGHLRTELSQLAKRAVVLAKPKDLTDLEVDEIRQYFK